MATLPVRSSVPNAEQMLDNASPTNTFKDNEMKITTSLEALQREEQRLVLDTISQVRKCGLDSILSLPQLVVCGDQSAGKSSVLEALTEIPFPRSDNLCTRFATEIIMRRAAAESLAIRVVPDTARPTAEQEQIKAFQRSITDFSDLPKVMNEALVVMGIESSDTSSRAFAKDVLSIEIEGPTRPQLTVVDLPGIIQNETKGVTTSDVKLVHEITDSYISQERTICLAVVSATNDYSNQPILTKVRDFDKNGDRTLGIITKPDRLPSGSGSEKAFIELAQNNDIFFRLGWHVLKNRTFEEASCSFAERNASEAEFFAQSNFKSLPQDCVGIDALRERLSVLLFEHVKQELPKLRDDLDQALDETKSLFSTLGNSRVTPQECRVYLTRLSSELHVICRDAVNGQYENAYFRLPAYEAFTVDSPASIRRLRAVVQAMNARFVTNFRRSAHTYHIGNKNGTSHARGQIPTDLSLDPMSKSPKQLGYGDALHWVQQELGKIRGKELEGNFNPLVIGELFWQQSYKWNSFAREHVLEISGICTKFLDVLFKEHCAGDVYMRLRSTYVQDAVKQREASALKELSMIWEDHQSFPINYNHYYTDTIKKNRLRRDSGTWTACLKNATTHTKLPGCQSDHTSARVDFDRAVSEYAHTIDPDMESNSCEEALDCLLAIYKLEQKTFTRNITTQVIERHMIRGLERVFSPIVISELGDHDVFGLASEPSSVKRQRAFLGDRIMKLEDGHGILKSVMNRAVS